MKKEDEIVLKIQEFHAGYTDVEIIKDLYMEVERNSVTAMMGPSGCGKTTLIRCVNRMHELTPGGWARGKIHLEGEELMRLNPILVRRKIGMVFQRPNPFPTMSIYDNVIAGYKLNGIRIARDERDKIVETSLKNAWLWDEVKDFLHRKGSFLSGGQQQRLCISRAIAMNPEILLLDEPTSALDPKSTMKIEELIVELKKTVTILLVTHNIAQAGRVADYTAFMYLGELVEFGTTEKLFTTPEDKRTEEYLSGKFG
jgi:phosphate transport system ATP-binding protein